MTRFFEPISASATHIYHSALELSPLSSIVRKFYYDQWHTPLPRVVVGTQKSWDQRITVGGKKDYVSYTWSPCGQFITTQSEEAVEIHDSLSFGLLSTLKSTKPTPKCTTLLAYSMDGHSIASLSNISLTVWDIQTGGVANEINHSSAHNVSLLWSLDGGTIGIVKAMDQKTKTYPVYIYNIALGTTHSPGALHSRDQPYLWAHDTSFQIMTTARTSQAYTINIFEVGTILTKSEPFHIGIQGEYCWIGSFSPATQHISIFFNQYFIICDIQSSDHLLRQSEYSQYHCFSSNGGLFAAWLESSVHIWKYTSRCYIPWRKFSSQDRDPFCNPLLQFSPTFTSLSGWSRGGILHLWHLDGSPIDGHPNSCKSPVALSCCGRYIALSESGHTVTIISLLSSTPSCIINTGKIVEMLALTGNVLLVQNSKEIRAWRLTEEGVVDSVSANKRANPSNAIWAISQCGTLKFCVQDQIVVIKGSSIKSGKDVIHGYCPGTGEVLKPTKAILHSPHNRRSLLELQCGSHNLLIHEPGRQDTPSESNGQVLWTTLQEGWVKDPKGNCQLWLPVEWRRYRQGWSCDSKVLRLGRQEAIIIKF